MPAGSTSAAAPDYVPGHGLLAGKAVLVTAAAGTGIGFATAKRCLEEGGAASDDPDSEIRTPDLQDTP